MNLYELLSIDLRKRNIFTSLTSHMNNRVNLILLQLRREQEEANNVDASTPLTGHNNGHGTNGVSSGHTTDNGHVTSGSAENHPLVSLRPNAR